MMKTILCYGDSNTWGYVPGSGTRFEESIRWTGHLQHKLGPGYRVVEAGVNGRTTAFDDPLCDYLNGRKGLPFVLLAAKPVDLLIISLGTNDLKFTDARGSSKGLESLLNMALSSETLFSGTDQGGIFYNPPKILVVSPISLDVGICNRIPPSSLGTKHEESQKFQEFYRPVCKRKQVEFLNGAQFAAPSPVDCIHMDSTGHHSFGEAVLAKTKEILTNETERLR